MAPDRGPTGRWTAGFSMIEVLLVIVLLSIVMGVGFTELRQYNETTIVDRASRTLASDVSLTRSYAVRRREDVTLEADEGGRSYAIRAGSDTLQMRWFRASSDLPLTKLDVQTTGDTFTFNARGLLVGGGQVDVEVGRLGKEKRIRISPLGRTEITTLP